MIIRQMGGGGYTKSKTSTTELTDNYVMKDDEIAQVTFPLIIMIFCVQFDSKLKHSETP